MIPKTIDAERPANFPQRLLDAKDLAARYGKSPSSIYRLNCYSPEELPPSIKIGNALRWRPEDVDAWEASKVGK